MLPCCGGRSRSQPPGCGVTVTSVHPPALSSMLHHAPKQTFQTSCGFLFALTIESIIGRRCTRGSNMAGACQGDDLMTNSSAKHDEASTEIIQASRTCPALHAMIVLQWDWVHLSSSYTGSKKCAQSTEGHLEMTAGHVLGLNASQASAQSLLMHSRASSKSSGSKQPTYAAASENDSGTDSGRSSLRLRHTACHSRPPSTACSSLHACTTAHYAWC